MIGRESKAAMSTCATGRDKSSAFVHFLFAIGATLLGGSQAPLAALSLLTARGWRAEHRECRNARAARRSCSPGRWVRARRGVGGRRAGLRRADSASRPGGGAGAGHGTPGDRAGMLDADEA